MAAEEPIITATEPDLIEQEKQHLITLVEEASNLPHFKARDFAETVLKLINLTIEQRKRS